ncbi:histidine--tRNA ligase [Synechococcus sp. M16CYN]
MVDLLPKALQRWQVVEAIARTHFQHSGFKEIRTPLMETTDLFCRGIGESTDVVGKEMYTFQDRGNRSCTLRPEGTASVVRAALQHGLISQGTQKLWYGGPMFRYERPQAGRQRQFHQIGVEWLGAASARTDVEVIALAWDLLTSLGVSDLELELNSLGSIEDRHLYRCALVAWLKQQSDQLDKDSRMRLLTNPLRILDSKDKTTRALLEEAPTLGDYLNSESRTRFSVVQRGLITLGIPFRLNPRLVRGLDYYCHTAFEITSKQLGAQATVCGGGRYDHLVSQLGGAETPAIGWALGMERLLLILEETSKANPDGRASRLITATKPDAYVVNCGERAAEPALVLARALRMQGLTVELDSSGATFSKQFKRADRCGARFALILGDKEVDRGQIQIKPLRVEGDEVIRSINAISAIVDILQNR